MTIAYSQINYFRLAQPPHHGRGPAMPVIVEAEGYPKDTKAKCKVGQDDDGRTIWGFVQNYRGLDKRLVREYNPRYTGAALREIRARKGVGRPWLTLLPQNDTT